MLGAAAALFLLPETRDKTFSQLETIFAPEGEDLKMAHKIGFVGEKQRV